MAEQTNTMTVDEIRNCFSSLNSFITTFGKEINRIKDGEVVDATNKIHSLVEAFKNSGDEKSVAKQVSTILGTYESMVAEINNHSTPTVEVNISTLSSFKGQLDTIKRAMLRIPVWDLDLDKKSGGISDAFQEWKDEEKRIKSLLGKPVEEGGTTQEDLDSHLSRKPSKEDQIDKNKGMSINEILNTYSNVGEQIGTVYDKLSGLSSIGYYDFVSIAEGMGLAEAYNTSTKQFEYVNNSKTPATINGICSSLGSIASALNSVKDYTPKKDTAGKKYVIATEFDGEGKPTKWEEREDKSNLGIESKIKTIPLLASAIGLFSDNVQELSSDQRIGYFRDFELRKSLSALKPYRTDNGWGSGTAEQITGVSSVLKLVGNALNLVKDYTPKSDEGGKQWEPIAFSLDGKPTMWEEVEVTTRLGLESRIRTIPKLASAIGMFSRNISALVSDPDIAYFTDFKLREKMSPFKPYSYKTDKGTVWGSGTAEQITVTASILQQVSKAMDKIPEYGTVKEGQKPIIARLNILRKRLPRDVSSLADLLIDVHDSQTGIDTIAKKLRLGSDFDIIESYRDPEGNLVSVKTYNDIASKKPDEALNYRANTKSTSSLVYIDLAANYVNSLVKTLSKISSISNKNLRKSSRSAKRLSKTIPNTMRDIAMMLRTISSTEGLDSPAAVRKLIGWNEGNGQEFVTYKVQAPDGTYYEKILETKSDSDWGGTEKVKNLKYVKPHYEAETGLFLIGDYVSKLVGSMDKITSLDPIGIRKKAIRFRMGIRPLVGMLKAAVTELTRQLGESTIDSSTIEFLTGSEKSEERYLDILKKGYSTGGENARETSTEDRTVEKISTKKVGLLDVTGIVFEIIDKMVNFPFEDNIKKLFLFRVKSGMLGRQVKKSVTRLLNVFDAVSESADSKNLSKDNMSKLMGFVGKDGLQGLISELSKTTDMYSDMYKKVLTINAMRAITLGKKRRKSANGVEKDPVIDLIDTMLSIALCMTEDYQLIDGEGKTTFLTNAEVKEGSERAKQLSGLFAAMIPATMAFKTLQLVSFAGKKYKGNNVRRLFESMVNSVSGLQDAGRLEDAQYNAVTMLAVFSEMIPLTIE